jgi:hypothetical protein
VKQITNGSVYVAHNIEVGGDMIVKGLVVTNPSVHIAATGTNVHGNGTMALMSTNDYTGTVANASAATNYIGTNTLQAQITAHTTNTANPHAVTAEQAGAVATNDPAITNRVAFNFRANLTATVDGTNIYVDVTGVLTNTGTNAGQAYDGASGASVSGQVDVLNGKTNGWDAKQTTNGDTSGMSGCPSGAATTQRVAALESAYQSWGTNILTPDAGGTVTVYAANAPLFKVPDPGTNITLHIDADSFLALGTNGIKRLNGIFDCRTNKITFIAEEITNSTWTTRTNNDTAGYWRLIGTNTQWEGRSYP